MRVTEPAPPAAHADDMPRAPGGQDGFTYIGVLVVITVLGLVATSGIQLSALAQRRSAEQALLDIGADFSDALQRYAADTPPGQPTQPPNLDALLRDPRSPAPRRYLRRIYADPFTGSTDWGITYASGTTGVLEIYSRSSGRTLKRGHFEPRFASFEGTSRLSAWRFSAQTAALPSPPGSTTPGAAPPSGSAPSPFSSGL
ncbi:type II secretion system protein [Stenotrophomonas sp. 24(2023)]|uniref:type II secretion system protein n=1 Tax=Stenotrophomonas sp. 24(2023) TaxID=3068324 RepID=UPI0027E054F5|nr:type II secretion system protein [Stenotrophomonas sp. 24(2023)]WMJ70181.1 type II secretion system protein [Stenotrophomonas sp. 24(2023)]